MRADKPHFAPSKRRFANSELTDIGRNLDDRSQAAEGIVMDSSPTMATPGIVTDYFEMDSAVVGARFGISVALPRGYPRDGRDAPLVYATDGNMIAPLADAIRAGLTDSQTERPVEPYIQVSVGYTAVDAPNHLVLRNRDLVPPGEGVPEFMHEHIRARLGADSTAAPAVTAFFDQQANAHADHFLTFLEEELHPEIARRYRHRGADIGLFGYSYGGLFTLYALTAGSGLFSRFGACSPGVVVPQSTIYARYEKLVAASDPAPRPTHLHLTVNAHEMLGPSTFYRHLGIEFLRFLDLVTERPLPGLRVTTDLLLGEGHGSGVADAYRSYLRACYPGRPS